MSTDGFAYLLLGIVEHFNGERFPAKLQFGLAALANQLQGQAPKTLQGTLQRCTQPIETWWTVEQLPSNIDPNEPLFFGDDDAVQFPPSVKQYLQSLMTNDRYSQAKADIKSLMDSFHFVQFRDMLRDKFEQEAESVQSTYQTVRQFLIENPFTTKNAIVDLCRQLEHVQPQEIRAFYDRFSSVEGMLREPENGRIHACQRCGPLRIKEGEPQSVKPDVCGTHCPQYHDGWLQIDSSEIGLVLRLGIQKSTLIPGKPELHLYQKLQAMQKQFPNQIEKIELWPRLDLYDLALYFDDALWVVDVKDWRATSNFGRRLGELPRADRYEWHKAFYLYPDEREQQDRAYGQKMRQQADLFQTEIVSLSQFVTAVYSKLRQKRT